MFSYIDKSEYERASFIYTLKTFISINMQNQKLLAAIMSDNDSSIPGVLWRLYSATGL
jgi:hypothetical protein